MDKPADEDRLIELADLYLFDESSPQDFAELQAAVLSSPEVRDLFWERVQWHASVREFCKRRTVVELAKGLARTDNDAPQASQPGRQTEAADHSPLPLTSESLPAPTPLLPTPATNTDQSVSSPVLGFLGGVVSYISHSRTLMFSLMFAGLGIYFIAQYGTVLLGRFWAQNAQVADVRGGASDGKRKVKDDGPIDPNVPAGKIVARLTNVVDSKWEFPRAGQGESGGKQVELAIGTEFAAGQKLTLTNGLAELTFDSGATVILHAPAQFAVGDALGGDLHVGKLTAKVPHSAHGFTIGTPGGKVVDLGTEFGVKVRDDGMMNVIVYVGDVQIESGAGGMGVGAADGLKVVHLKAGQAVTVGPDHIAKPVPPENERFVRDLAPLGDKTKAEAAYVEFMKSLKPAVWFRMEGKENDRVLHDEVEGGDAKLSWDGPGNPFVKGPIGKSLWLRGEALKDGATLADYPKADHKKLTVVAWAYADSRPRWATVAKNWGGLQGKGGQFSLELYVIDQRRDRESYDISASICQTDGKLVTVREGVGHPFPLNEWQHVAFVADGAKLRLYRQGSEVAVVEYTSLNYPPALKSLGVGVRAPDEANAGAVNCWSGKLDEVAVFNDALSPADIKRLANAAPR